MVSSQLNSSCWATCGNAIKFIKDCPLTRLTRDFDWGVVSGVRLLNWGIRPVFRNAKIQTHTNDTIFLKLEIQIVLRLFESIRVTTGAFNGTPPLLLSLCNILGERQCGPYAMWTIPKARRTLTLCTCTYSLKQQ